jgi:hypothetical protein
MGDLHHRSLKTLRDAAAIERGNRILQPSISCAGLRRPLSGVAVARVDAPPPVDDGARRAGAVVQWPLAAGPRTLPMTRDLAARVGR